MPLNEQEKASIAVRRRVWEARKYCQVKPSLAQYARAGEAPVEQLFGQDQDHGRLDPDPALAALLRGVQQHLSADLVMISLLDDHTQYFISGVTDATFGDAEVTLESTKWYGCDHVSHHGGLCERTITVKQTPGEPVTLYEVLDMKAAQKTQHLPFVDGTIAEFRHYVGIPLTTPEGYNIGTVFAMSRNSPEVGISAAQRHYLHETSKHVMSQLVQAIQALEGRRAAAYNAAVASLLNGQAYNEIELIHNRHPGNAQLEVATSVYSVSANLLRDFFGLAGVVFQEVPLSRSRSNSYTKGSPDHMLASSLRPGMSAIIPVGLGNVDKLLEIFPQGGILYTTEQGAENAFASDANRDMSPVDPGITGALNASFPDAKQIIFAPLWNAIHCRTTAICFGWVTDDARVYQAGCDLTALSSFCMVTISHVQRLESRYLDQVKSDFLGSISHETRSPLHNVLGNLELLLSTDCSEEQREMLVNASFGATQLLGSIDKILQHSRISAPSAVVYESQAANEPNTLSINNLQTQKDEDQGRGNNLQMGRQQDDRGAASGATDLISLFEEVVEDVAKRMRLSDTIMSPKLGQRATSSQSSSQKTLQTVSDVDGNKEGRFSIIVLDASLTDNCQVPSNSGIRIILENLLSNAVKFTRVDCCVRCSLTVSSDYAVCSVIDCGRGFSREFVRHSLYVPFSQQDPIDDGMGLGMSLIKQNVEELCGTIQIDTEQTLGTTVTVSLPLQQLTQGVEQQLEKGPQRCRGTSFLPPLPNRPESELPVLRACVYAPSSWTKRFDGRDKRSINELRESLRHTLEAWFRPAITIWHEMDHEEGRELPDLVFVTDNDLDVFRQTSGGKFKDVKIIVICADIGKNSVFDHNRIKAASAVADAIITGSVIPSKLWKTLTAFFPHIIPVDADTVERSFQDLGIYDQLDEKHNQFRTPATGEQQDEQVAVQSDALNNSAFGTTHDNSNALEEQKPMPRNEPPERNGNTICLQRSTDVQPKTTRRPRVLLVDDNSVNLKVLGMFVTKSGVPKIDQKSATGGQEAIDIYKEAIENSDGLRFDIVFMDLSMPVVSGFDATAAIRRIEDSKASKRAYIVALTGLVGEKDRIAAADAGVDDYVTKPAGLKNVQAVIQSWADD